MKRILTIWSIFAILSCKTPFDKHVQNPIQNVPIEKGEVDSKLEQEELSNDWRFGRENGGFLKYVWEGENMFIEFGNKKFKKIYDDTIAFAKIYTRVPQLWWENEDFICLKYSCGNPCWGTIILPLNEKDTIQNYMYQYGYDDKRNVIFYLDYESEKDRPFLVVRNLKTKETEEIEFDACGDIAFMGYCIDSISYINGNLFLRTRNEHELTEGIDSKGSNVIRRKIKI